MKKTIALASIIAILFSSFVCFSSNVYADTGYTATTIPASATTKTLTITRDVKNVTNKVTNTFTYTIANVSKPATATIGSMPTTLDVTFTNVVPAASTKIATATATLDFSSVTFDELGDYQFTVTETASTDATRYPIDSTKTYYVYVSVRNELDGTNTPTGNLVVTLLDQVKNNNTGDKTNLYFESTVEQTYIELSNRVTGNMARKDVYFPYTISFTDDRLIEGDKFDVIGGSYASNPSQLTVGATNVVYLKHGETITIGRTSAGLNQIPIGVKYDITEGTDTKSEEYHTYIDGSTTDTKVMTQKTTVKVPTAGNETEETAFNTNNKTAYVNNRETSVVTGIFINVAPFALLIALAFVGIVIIRKTSKKEN